MLSLVWVLARGWLGGLLSQGEKVREGFRQVILCLALQEVRDSTLQMGIGEHRLKPEMATDTLS